MLVVPNAGDTTSGARYEALDQAEPDALDFETLGNSGSGVVSGCVVSSNNSASNVAVSAGSVTLNGVVYDISASATLSLPSAPADNRFDLVVVRVIAGVPGLVVVQGDNSATNPTFPKSATVLTGTPGTNNFNPDTDVLLAALYRTGSAAVTSSRIVDKSIRRYSNIVNQGAAVPLSTQGTGPGDFYFQTTPSTGLTSGVWVKSPNGDFIELAMNVGSHLPIGAAVAWPTSAAVPVGCLEFNGQALSTAAYPGLFSVYGYQHGGSGGTFFMPNWNNKYIRGTTSTAVVNTTIGSDLVTLTSANMPEHSHTMTHTHSFTHTHGINHTHTATNTSAASPAAMSGTSSAVAGDPRLYVSDGTWYNNVPHIQAIMNYGGWPTSGTPGLLYGDIAGVARLEPNSSLWTGPQANRQYGVDDLTPHQHTVTVTGGSHSHPIPALAYTGNTTSQSTTTTGAASSSSTGLTGLGTAVDVRPASVHTRWICRASLGTDTSVVGYPYQRVFSQALEFDSPTVGDNYLWLAAFDCIVSKVSAYRADGTTFDVNVRIASTTYALDDDLETTSGTWTSALASEDAVVTEGDLVEISIMNVSGSPTVCYVQVDFQN